MIENPFKHTLPRTAATVEEGLEKGLHFGGQAYVSLNGKTVVDTAFGALGPDGGAAMATGALMLWVSACKPVGAVAVARLWEQGRLDLDEPVSEIVPEFAQGGKSAITMRHILTHTGGFRAKGRIDPAQPWDDIIQYVCAMPLEEGWIPGETAGYHPRSSWYILGEVVRRIDGRPYAQFVREDIFEPLGMKDSWIGMDVEAYRAYGERIAIAYETRSAETKPRLRHSEKEVTGCFPGGNGRGPIRELGWFYETLLNGGARNGYSLLDSATVAEFTRPHRIGLYDETFRHKMDWGLGFIIDSKHHGPRTVPYGYGLRSSPATFGHGGVQSTSGFADPKHRLVVAVAFNGTPGEAKHNKRIRHFATAVYEDLELGARSD